MLFWGSAVHSSEAAFLPGLFRSIQSSAAVYLQHLERDRLPGVCVAFGLSTHKLGVLVTSLAEPMGSIMKENINMGENPSTVRKREGRGRERKKERDSKAR